MSTLLKMNRAVFVTKSQLGLFETTFPKTVCFQIACTGTCTCMGLYFYAQIVISAHVPTKTCMFCMCALEKE